MEGEYFCRICQGWYPAGHMCGGASATAPEVRFTFHEGVWTQLSLTEADVRRIVREELEAVRAERQVKAVQPYVLHNSNASASPPSMPTGRRHQAVPE